MGGGDLIVDCAVVKYQLMIAVILMKKDILKKGKHSKYYEKEMCHRLLLSQFSIFSFSTLIFLLYPDFMPSRCNNAMSDS